MIENKQFDKLYDYLYFKEENAWIIEELPSIWECYEISTFNTIHLENITDGLYAVVIQYDILNTDTGVTEAVDLHPYVAKIEEEWKVIINVRDIPANFDLPFEVENELIVPLSK